MAIHSFRNVATLSLAITLELFIGSPLASLAQIIPSPSQEVAINWTPPGGRGAPANTEGAGSRNDATCSEEETTPNPPLTALMPVNTMALTVAARPTFFVYIPETSATTAELILKDENEENVYTTTINLPGKPGIVSISFPANANPLQTGKTYRWYFDLVCNSNKRVFLERLMVQRVEESANLQRELAKATASDRPDIYARNGLWYDTLMALVAQRSPANNATFTANWKQLLEAVGLKAIADKELINCCTPQNPTVSNPVQP